MVLLGDEMELPWVDPRDPNYDSDREEAAEVGPGVGGNKTIELAPPGCQAHMGNYSNSG